MSLRHHPDPSEGPNVVGVYLGHDPSCCLLRGGRIEVAIEEERLNRYKHGRPRALGGLWRRFAGRFGYFPWASLTYCLRTAGLELSDIDLFLVGDDQWAAEARTTLADVIPLLEPDRVLYVDRPEGAVHHLHHALSSFHLSPFDEAAVLVVDGDGNVNADGYEAETGFLMRRGGAASEVFKNRYLDRAPPRGGIGWMYEQVSYLLGYGNHEIGLAQPGKTMGLSAYGEPTDELSEPWIEPDGFHLDFSGFKRWLLEAGYDQMIFGHPAGIATRHRTPPAFAENLAFKVQTETERAVLHLASELRDRSGATRLCLGGGVALNSVANGKLAQSGLYEEVHVIPAVHDGGQSLGLAIHGHLLLTAPGFESDMRRRYSPPRSFSPRPVFPLTTAYLGRSYGPVEIGEALAQCGLPHEVLSEDELLDSASDALAQGHAVGWFQGGSEIGPRALGNRSILASPNDPGAKDRLNSRVKFREPFRPFAPAVPAEESSRIFEPAADSPYMARVLSVREEWRSRIPAVVHVDGTARLQTVSESANPLFHRLLRAFERRTGVPVLLNTSFNLAGMPIVESPTDALHCFLETQLDELYLGQVRVPAPPPASSIFALKSGWDLHVPLLDTARVRLRAPDGWTTDVSLPSGAARLLSRLDGSATVLEAAAGLGFDATSWLPLDAALKHLVRLGCLELRVGSWRLSNTRHDSGWDAILYESGSA